MSTCKTLNVQLTSEQNSPSRRWNFGGKFNIWDKERTKYIFIFFFIWQILNIFEKLNFKDALKTVVSKLWLCRAMYKKPVCSSWLLCGHAKHSGFSTIQAALAMQHEKLEDRKILKLFCFKLVVYLQLFVSPSSLIIVGSLIF